MKSEQFDVERVKTYWLTEAEEALQVADHLLEKADYSYALFFGHLAIEKLLKALYAKTMRHQFITCSGWPEEPAWNWMKQ